MQKPLKKNYLNNSQPIICTHPKVVDNKDIDLESWSDICHTLSQSCDDL